MNNSLREDIKFNCDVSDSRFWGFFSICGLLMRYRDLYRSEKGLKPWANIERKDIAAWIADKEVRWPELEQKEFRNPTIKGKTYDPFDVEGINQALKPEGLVYGAGYAMYMKPTFFLAQLKELKETAGLTVHVSGVEYIRDLFTAPAMLQGSTIFLRLEPLLILLHYKFSELNVKQSPVLEDALLQYGFRHRQLMDDTFEKRLEALAARYADIILHHEIAEFKEGAPEWKELLAAAGDRKNEHYLRAVKDLIADTSEYGPFKRIIDTRDRGALGLSLALMEGHRRLLFPELKKAHAKLVEDGEWNAIDEARTACYRRMISERERIMNVYRESGGKEAFENRLKEMISVQS